MKIVAAFFGIVFMSCHHREAGETAYVRYVDDPHHKITQEINIGDMKATAKWLPADYRRIRSQATTEPQSPEDPSLYYFNVRFEKSKGNKPTKEKELYLDFDIQKDFVLLDGRDSIMPVICQKIEDGISGSYQYMVAFETNSRQQNDFAMIYNDKIFGIGTLSFMYKQDDIQKIPDLKQEENR